MAEPTTAKLRVFVDADVLFAGAASPQDHSASQVILRLGEITLIDAVTSRQAVVEAERNLEAYMPDALPAFRHLVSRSLRSVDDPERDEVLRYAGLAHAKDLPLLACALHEDCPLLVTFNVRDYQPGHPDVEVIKPGALVRRIRARLTGL
jgi:hypothetical protein